MVDIDIQLTKEETEYLGTFLDSWTSKSRKEKNTLKNTIVTKILQDRQHDPEDMWARAFMKLKVASWMSNHVTNRNNRLPRVLKTLWTGREVYCIKHVDDVVAETERMVAAGVHHIAAVNKARASLWNDLSDDEKHEWETMAEQWNIEGPDEEVRAEIAEKRLPDWVQGFTALLSDQASAIVWIYFYYLDKNGKLKSGRPLS
ncbi:hypothetical protein C8Q76DRAFT_698321 [Earliella scabrosa]|nr:hypothetical protein C8Q76DRAFT_699275 [Earliella scabrosa]KAI0683482.1 hypothetical protein C8Q76DRAFT_699164 [Earliella scabrosa]KAI0694782.1 hypothetical protein C8Q76DRAFT_698321 [Earliella scabrosa]